MFHIGDHVLVGDKVGCIVNKEKDVITLKCNDGQIRTENQNNVTLVADYKELIKALKAQVITNGCW